MDTDRAIEQSIGEKISNIFKTYGEKFFRQQEREMVLSLKEKENYVISTGGGLWLDEKNRKELLRMGWCVWLKISAQGSWKRISKNLSQRPLLTKEEDPFEFVRKSLGARDPLYSLAHYSVNTEGKSPVVVVQEIKKALQKIKPFDLH